MDCNLARHFFENAAKSPGRLALWAEGQYYTYGEIAERALKLAGWLLQNMESGGNVGIYASRTLEAYLGVLAATTCGLPFVPIHSAWPPSYAERIAVRSRLSALILDPRAVRGGLEVLKKWSPRSFAAPAPGRAIDGAVSADDLGAQEPLSSPAKVKGDNLAYIMFTSGTTGFPKAIGATAENVEAFLKASLKRYELNAEDRFSQFNDLTWDPSIFDIFMPWRVGGSIHALASGDTMNPCRFIREHGLTVWYSTPTQIAIMTRLRALRPNSLPSLRLSLFVGEPLSEKNAKAWSEAAPNSIVENVYGPTEATVVCTGQPYKPGQEEIITPSRGYVAIGTTYEGTLMEVVDENLKFLAPNERGEFLIGGPQLTPGYWEDPENTRKAFLTLDHPVLGPSRWYRTGDYGYRSEEGIFHFLGRIDNQIQVMGKRVEVEEVEGALRKTTGESGVAVVGWPMRDGSAEGLVAFVEAENIDTPAQKAALREYLPSYMVPRRIIALEPLPRNVNGKIERKALQRFLEEGDG